MELAQLEILSRYLLMRGDLVSVRILALFGSAQDRDLLRQAAATTTVPIDVVEAESAAAVCDLLATNDIDVAFLDAAATLAELTSFVAAARSAQPPPFVVLVVTGAWDTGRSRAAALATDGLVARPEHLKQAQALIDRCVRLRLPSGVLVVDDSAVTRGIVCKVLAGTRFSLQIAEAADGIGALERIAAGKFDVVFLDYHMPGLNGIETLHEIKRQHPHIEVVIMTSLPDEALPERARAAGAAAFLRKPFYPPDIDAVLRRVYGLRESAQG
jgi:CheY-like chemotaxis protein